MTRQLTLEHFEPAIVTSASRDFSDPSGSAEGLESAETAPDQIEKTDADELSNDSEEGIRSARADVLARLNNVLDVADQDFVMTVSRQTQWFAESTSNAVTEMLPHLIDAVGKSELSANVVAILERARVRDAELHVSPEDHEAFVECLTELASPIELKVNPAKSQPPGTARLVWANGGAELNAADFLESALKILQRDTANA